MPILPENKDRYPANWPEIRQSILDRAGNCCEICGVRGSSLFDSEGAVSGSGATNSNGCV